MEAYIIAESSIEVPMPQLWTLLNFIRLLLFRSSMRILLGDSSLDHCHCNLPRPQKADTTALVELFLAKCMTAYPKLPNNKP